jgi:hypothetical protein
MVGDRLDTDIAGARRAGTDSLLVMTGVSALADVLAAGPDERPTWIGDDLRSLTRPGCRAAEADDRWQAGPWTVESIDGRLTVSGVGSTPEDADSWWTAVAAAAWAHLDRTGSAADGDGLTVPGTESVPG